MSHVVGRRSVVPSRLALFCVFLSFGCSVSVPPDSPFAVDDEAGDNRAYEVDVALMSDDGERIRCAELRVGDYYTATASRDGSSATNPYTSVPVALDATNTLDLLGSDGESLASISFELTDSDYTKAGETARELIEGQVTLEADPSRPILRWKVPSSVEELLPGCREVRVSVDPGATTDLSSCAKWGYTLFASIDGSSGTWVDGTHLEYQEGAPDAKMETLQFPPRDGYLGYSAWISTSTHNYLHEVVSKSVVVETNESDLGVTLDFVADDCVRAANWVRERCAGWESLPEVAYCNEDRAQQKAADLMAFLEDGGSCEDAAKQRLLPAVESWRDIQGYRNGLSVTLCP